MIGLANIGAGTALTIAVTIAGLVVAFFAIKNSILSSQESEVNFATRRAKRFEEETISLKAEVVRLQAQTDLSTVLQKIDDGNVKTHAQLDIFTVNQERTIISLDQILEQLKANA